MRHATIVVFLLSSMLLVSAANADHVAPRLIVVGNSLSTTHHSWPQVLGDISDRWVIHVMAQNGRTVRDFSFPRDLFTSGDKNDTVVYMLGSNDIGQRNHIDYAKYQLQTQLSFLLERNFNVLLIIPPSFGLDEEVYGESNRRHRALFESYRGTHPRLWIYDLDNVWDPALTTDGIHPSDELSAAIAEAINWVLAMNIY